MYPFLRFLAAGCCMAAVFASAQTPGSLEVSFVDPTRFADAGTSPWERDTNLRTISEHLQQLGRQHLKPGQTLKIEVLDVDLAGHTRPTRHIADLRFSKGMADWPKISVRYVLQAGGAVQRSGEETIDHLGYLQRSADHYRFEPLRHEKQMLERWFKARFGE